MLERIGPGTSAYPSCSISTASSIVPSSCPPYFSETIRPGQLRALISRHMSSLKASSDSASSRIRSDLRRAARNSLAASWSIRCSSVRSKFIQSPPLAQLGKAEHALGDDVLEDVRRAALDRIGTGAQELVLPV